MRIRVMSGTSSLHHVAGDEAAALGQDEQLLHAAAEELLLPQASSESGQELDGQVCTRPRRMVAVAAIAPVSCARTAHQAVRSLLIEPCKAVRYL